MTLGPWALGSGGSHSFYSLGISCIHQLPQSLDFLLVPDWDDQTNQLSGLGFFPFLLD